MVPGRCQIICNRQPSLEVWTPVVDPCHVATSPAGGASRPGHLRRQPSFLDDTFTSFGIAPRTLSPSITGMLSSTAVTAVLQPVLQASGFDTSTGGGGGGGGVGGGAPPKVDPCSFRRHYAEPREEYNRRKAGGAMEGSLWVYDVACGGNRLFLAREDMRSGGAGAGSIEVWETRRQLAAIR